MKEKQSLSTVIENPWVALRHFTDARIGLGRTGVNLPTKRLLEFQLAHAQAQDAVHLPLHVKDICTQLEGLHVNSEILEETSALILHSKAIDRTMYLQRPDFGRRLDESSYALLEKKFASQEKTYDLAIVIVDGLSSLAVTQNAVGFIQTLADSLAKDTQSWKLAPLSIVQQGRVAIGDEIGECINARATAVLIGERPGLSSPDSLGIYFTWNPKVGLTDANRNCISNVRLRGLSHKEASKKLLFLLHESRRLKISGVTLKDRTSDDSIIHHNKEDNFLIR